MGGRGAEGGAEPDGGGLSSCAAELEGGAGGGAAVSVGAGGADAAIAVDDCGAGGERAAAAPSDAPDHCECAEGGCRGDSVGRPVGGAGDGGWGQEVYECLGRMYDDLAGATSSFVRRSRQRCIVATERESTHSKSGLDANPRGQLRVASFQLNEPLGPTED